MADAGVEEIEILGTDLAFEIDQYNPLIGDALTVYGNFIAGQDVSVRIYYNTVPEAQAFSWMEPSQTAGGVLPYMYTQCEDINCRTVAPLMDTPANRVTYSARVVTNNTLVAKMSANETGIFNLNSTHNVASFRCDIAIPNYLMAIAVGDLEYRSLGRRVGVITEPSQMDRVATELAELEVLLDTTEAYIGEYIWGNYTVLVLPPSFPMGGMENPLLTFASPTIIVGDFSQVYVATHEIVHSWTGNSVTCQNWESFWLNEGFTVFIERKVSGELHGEDFALVEAQLGNMSMWSDMQYFGLDNTYSSIHPVLAGDNPDNSFTELPYEKGFQTLTYLESLVGADQFRMFLRFWVSSRLLTSV
jgi:leukotriene-A4 hydrolase